MLRTQIYLPKEDHASLTKLANQKNTSLSKLIREGVQEVLKKHYGTKSPQQKALKFLVGYPDKKRIKLSDSAVNLVRKERD